MHHDIYLAGNPQIVWSGPLICKPDIEVDNFLEKESNLPFNFSFPDMKEDKFVIWNLTTNFDVTWHEVHPYTDSGSWKVSFDITHKQKFFINNNILYKRLYSVFL